MIKTSEGCMKMCFGFAFKFQGNVGNNVLTKKVKHSQKLRKVIGTCMDPEIMYP